MFKLKMILSIPQKKMFLLFAVEEAFIIFFIILVNLLFYHQFQEGVHVQQSF